MVMLLNKAASLVLASSMEPRIIGFDLQLLADSGLSIIAVGTLFFFASYLLFNPVRKMLADRQAKIAAELEEAASGMASAEALKKEYEAKLSNVTVEAEEILSSARKRGADNESSIIAKAREDAARIIENAKTEAELEKDKVTDSLKTEIIDIAALLAEKAIATQMDVNVSDKLLKQALEEMGKTKWQS